MSESNFIMKPKVDVCFKGLMGNVTVRTGFISAVLGVKPDEIMDSELLPTIMEGESIDSKTGILDVRVRLRNRTQIDMEIQLGPFPLWPERSLFYWGKMYTSQMQKGDEYGVLEKCVHVGILDFVLFPGEKEYYSCFHLWGDQRKFKYTDKAEFHILELPKLSMYDYPQDELLRWARFLNAERKEEFETMAKEDNYIDEAYNQLVKLSADEKKRLEYEAREKALRDYNWLIHSNHKQGKSEGRSEAEIELIQKKLAKGMDAATIAEFLEEPVGYVEKIAVLIRDNPTTDAEGILKKLTVATAQNGGNNS